MRTGLCTWHGDSCRGAQALAIFDAGPADDGGHATLLPVGTLTQFALARLGPASHFFEQVAQPMHHRHRRSLLNHLAAACALVSLPGLAQAQPRWTVSLDQLQERVAQRFPLRYPVQGMLDLTVHTPQLAPLPAANRLSAAMAVDAAGQALRRAHSGQLVVEFALRYEPSDRTVRAHQLRLARLQFPTLQPAVVDLLNVYGPALAQQSLMEVVLHQVKPQELALLDGLGLQPGAITVTDSGLEVAFVHRPPG